MLCGGLSKASLVLEGGLRCQRRVRHKNRRLAGADATLPQTLSTLDVSYNNLTAIPLCVGRLENLKNLYMSSNFISSLPDALKSLPVLKSLNIAGNLLGAVADWISDSFPVLERACFFFCATFACRFRGLICHTLDLSQPF